MVATASYSRNVSCCSSPSTEAPVMPPRMPTLSKRVSSAWLGQGARRNKAKHVIADLKPIADSFFAPLLLPSRWGCNRSCAFILFNGFKEAAHGLPDRSGIQHPLHEVPDEIARVSLRPKIGGDRVPLVDPL